MRRRAKVDLNQPEIVFALRRCGFSVLDLHQLGGGCPDLLVAHKTRPMWSVLVEIKSPKGKENDLQIEFRKSWNGPIMLARDYMDVLRFFGLATK